MLPQGARYVNRMFNICYMTGVIRHNPENPRQFFLSQTSNPSLDIPINLPSPDFVLPPQGKLRTITAHVHGQAGDYGQTAYARMISIGQASVLNVAPMSSFLLGFAKRLPKGKIPEGSPYTSAGLLKEEIVRELRALEDLSAEERTVIDLYDDQAGRMRGRFDSNSNSVQIAGVIDSVSYVPPNPYQEHGVGIIALRQHPQASKIIPIRVVNSKVSTVLKNLRGGNFISIKGRLRRKIMPTPDGTGILSDLVYVETDMINPADQSHILSPLPTWIAEYSRKAQQEMVEDEQKERPVTPMNQTDGADPSDAQEGDDV